MQIIDVVIHSFNTIDLVLRLLDKNDETGKSVD